ncbi:AsmA family protein [Fulvivirga kasyanovii]|uniref:AsmA family protein n=1 Tax=Fulvivirga kasyanovii TaxID=396812 RepID=A0ABW9RNQ1_9BACT|nr:AsmA-like C-terminal region-containing protein [Fulvivirga kasyanovii]MTI24963.1 AsmA family protein [Fulvivirga kasyanovii]
MSIKRILRKTFLYLLLAASVVVISSVLVTFLYRDQLIDHFIREFNKNINTPVHVGKINVSSLSNFPQISLTFHDVNVEESYTDSSYPLLAAEKIDFTFNPIAVFRGNYTIEEIHLTNAKCHLKMNKQGEINYDIFKQPDTTQHQAVKLDLSKVRLKDVTFTYTNELKDVILEVFTKSTSANLSALGSTYDVETSGDAFLHYLMVNKSMWAENKDLFVNSKLNYNDDEKYLTINSSTVKVSGSDFGVFGSYIFKDKQLVDLAVEGKDTDIQTLLSLLPKGSSERFSKYRSKGNVYFDLVMKGEISDKKSPALEVNFGLVDSRLYHPDTDAQITHADLKGTFYAAEMAKLNTATLQLENISGELEGNSFKSNLYLKNFDEPYVKCDFSGRIDINSLFKFYKAENIRSGKGVLDANINFEGQLKDLKKKETAQKIKTSGEINLEHLYLALRDFPLPLEDLQGNLLFNNNDLALSDVSGSLGNSDFLLNGFFKNIIAYLLFDNEPVGIESDLKSDFIDLDQLLLANSGDKKDDSQYSFKISPRLVLKFDCDIKSLKFRRFKPTAIRGDLKVKNQVAVSDQITLNAMGGSIALSGMVDASRNKLVRVNTSFTLHDINVDSIFYVFENFNQDFLEDRHLKGKIFASVDAEMTFNDNLSLYSETLTSNISTTIKGGELNNFEPMQKLARYLDEDKLDHLQFSELKNDIHIENRTIYLPEMEVSSNITDIKITGTHTFDQNINYKVVAPLRSQRKIDKDEAFGAIEEDDSGRTMLFLKIIGTTSDYRVMYDKESVKKKVVSDLKKEVKELKDAFKNKGRDEQKTIELEEDDYFDWDN